MLKRTLSFLLIFIMAAPLAWAKTVTEAGLKQDFGSDLSHAPFVLRYSFSKKYKKDWAKTSYSERKDFLMDYEKGLAAQQAEEKAEAKAELDKQRQIHQERLDKIRRDKQRAQADRDEARAEEQEDQDRQRAFNDTLRDERMGLQQTEQQFIQDKEANSRR